eukprot:7137286-Alexandrium_andersonii.AAC.1
MTAPLAVLRGPGHARSAQELRRYTCRNVHTTGVASPGDATSPSNRGGLSSPRRAGARTDGPPGPRGERAPH